MTNSELGDWKQHPVTKKVFEALRSREEQVKETLAQVAGIDSGQDRELVGYIKALRDVYLVDAQDMGEVE